MGGDAAGEVDSRAEEVAGVGGAVAEEVIEIKKMTS